MARPPKTSDRGQLPRNQPDDKTVEGVPHTHADETGKVPVDENGKIVPHLHRLGDLPHLHGEDGKAVLLDEHGKPLFTQDDLAPVPAPSHEQIQAEAAARERARAEQARAAARERGEIVSAVTPADIQDMERIRKERTDAILPAGGNGPRPVSVSGAPGTRQADVISRMSTLALEGYPAEVQDEVIWTEIATHALMSMREEQARTKRHADPALVASAMDAVLHVAKARGLA